MQRSNRFYMFLRQKERTVKNLKTQMRLQIFDCPIWSSSERFLRQWLYSTDTFCHPTSGQKYVIGRGYEHPRPTNGMIEERAVTAASGKWNMLVTVDDFYVLIFTITTAAVQYSTYDFCKTAEESKSRRKRWPTVSTKRTLERTQGETMRQCARTFSCPQRASTIPNRYSNKLLNPRRFSKILATYSSL